LGEQHLFAFVKNITLFQLFGIFGEGKYIANTSK